MVKIFISILVLTGMSLYVFFGHSSFSTEKQQEPPPKGLSISMQPPIHLERFKKKLDILDIPYETKLYNENEYVIWSPEYSKTIQSIIYRVYPDNAFGTATLLIDAGRIDEGIEKMHQAANQGSAEALYALGIYYFQGNHVEGDRNKAIEFIRAAAEKGYPPALTNLGINTFNGTYGERNKVEGYHLLLKAAAGGEWTAICIISSYTEDDFSTQQQKERQKYKEIAEEDKYDCNRFNDFLRI